MCDICTLPLLCAGVVNTLQATKPFPCNQPSDGEAFYYFLLLQGKCVGVERHGWAYADRARRTALRRALRCVFKPRLNTISLIQSYPVLSSLGVPMPKNFVVLGKISLSGDQKRKKGEMRKGRERKREEKGKKRGRGWRVWYRGWLVELYYEKCSKI